MKPDISANPMNEKTVGIDKETKYASVIPEAPKK